MDVELSVLFLFAAAGLFQAVFADPVRYFKQWRWEQVWVAQSVTANVIFPVAWALVVPDPFWTVALYVPPAHWVSSYGWGLLWGIGGIGYGLILARLGIAFSTGFVFGVTTITGALVPLLFNVIGAPARPWHFVTGLILCVLATALIGWLQRSGECTPLVVMPIALRTFPSIVITT